MRFRAEHFETQEKKEQLTGNGKKIRHLGGQFLIGSVGNGTKQHHGAAEASCETHRLLFNFLTNKVSVFNQ